MTSDYMVRHYTIFARPEAWVLAAGLVVGFFAGRALWRWWEMRP